MTMQRPRGILSTLFAIGLLAGGRPGLGQPLAPARLSVGVPEAGRLNGGEAREFLLPATAGDYLHVTLERPEGGVALTLRDADTNAAVLDDPRNDDTLRLHVHFVSGGAGSLRLTLRARPGSNVRPYVLELLEQRPPLAGDLHRSAADRLVREAVASLGQGTGEGRRQALEALRASLPAWTAAGDERGEAEALGQIGQVHYQLGDFKASRDAHERSAVLFERIGDGAGRAGALGNLAVAYRVLGEPRKALEMQQAVAETWRSIGDRRKESYALHNIGAAHFGLGEYNRAIEMYERSIALKDAIGDEQGKGPTLSNMATTYGRLGEPLKGIELQERALQIRRRHGDSRGEAYDVMGLGAAHVSLGDWQRAVTYLTASVPMFRAVGDKRGEGQALHNAGAAYFALGDEERALETYREALDLRRSIGDPSTVATTLENIGSLYVRRGDTGAALPLLTEALTLKTQSGDRYGEAFVQSHLAALYRRTGHFTEALATAERALALSAALGDRAGEANALAQAGALKRVTGDSAGSLSALQRALGINQALRRADSEAEVRLELARLESGEGRAADGLRHLEAALAIVESLRSGVGSPDLRSSYLAAKHEYFELYIDLLMRQHRSQPAAGFDRRALVAAERSRARRLLDALSEAEVDVRRGADPGLLGREHDLSRRIDAKRAAVSRLLQVGTADDAAKGEAELRRLMVELQDVRGEMRARSPAYADLTAPAPVAVEAVQRNVLDARTALLEYAVGQDRSYLWVVTPTALSTYDLPGGREIGAAVERLRAAISARQQQPPIESAQRLRARIARADADYRRAARALSDMLLAPAWPLGAERLLVVADGPLEHVPFGALPQPGGGGPARATPLIAAHEVLNAPSITAVAAIRGRPRPREGRPSIAVFADPVFDAGDARVTGAREDSAQPAASASGVRTLRAARESGLNGLPRLRFSRREAEAVTALAGGRGIAALDFDASRAALARPEVASASVLHFATHALINQAHPDLSGIVLSLVDRNGGIEDGFVRLHDIYNLNLQADLVVLSACQTATGREMRGEGMQGLARGFMYAGARRVVASLWQVDDRATAALMTRFYSALLKERMSPGAALRSAALAMSRDPRWSAPYYWAGFVVHGDW